MRHRFRKLFRTAFAIASIAAGAFLATRSASAEDFDWRNVNGQNWLTSIKSQFGGTCWAFGSMGTVESHYMLTRNDLTFQPDVSEQQLVWETNPDMGDTGGGWEMNALNYVTSHGVVSETECPYDPNNPNVPVAGDPWPLASGWQNRVWKNVADGGVTSTTANMKALLKTNGPLLTALASWSDLYGSVDELKANYRGPVDGIDHAVVLVGYHDDASVPSGGYWVIKNSWSDGWGTGGYGFVPYGDLENHNRTEVINGATYYSGSTATATWNGGAGTWTVGGTNWNSAAYAWENKETSATFGGTGGAVTISGTAIAHGLTINSGSTGYSFTGGALTVTGGGITANETVSINSPVTVGSPQSWTVASGKTLNVNNAVHTVISNLTITGSGNTTISGPIDGGGIINIYGGAAPGNITKSGSGTLTLSGASYYTGRIAASAGTINFAPPTGVTSTYAGAISGSGTINKSGAGTVVFAGTNTYSSTTTVTGGALQADSGIGLPTASYLNLNGGVIQSNGTVTFSRSLGTSGSGRFRLNSNSGFAAGAGPMTVRINNGTGTINWGTTVGTNIVGTLKFGSSTAANVVTLQNGINLNAATRTIQVDDNPSTGADYAVISGVMSNSSGTAGLTKTGAGVLALTGANTYNGTTTISAGGLQVDSGAGLPTASFLSLDGGVLQCNNTATFSRTLGTSGSGKFLFTANGGGFSADANPMTVNIGGGTALTWGTTVGTNIVGTLKFGSATAANVTTFQNAVNLNGANRVIQVDDNPSSVADYARITGVISNGTGTAGLVKTGAGTLLLTGSNSYNGTTTISGGVLQGDLGVGIANSSFLSLDSGVYQTYSSSTTNFTRALGTSGTTFQMTANGGGFSAGSGALNVNVGNGAALTWGTTVGTNLVGTLKLSSNTAANVTTFQNAVDFGGASRTVQVDNNPNSTADYAVLSGVLSGAGSLTKTGLGSLQLTGAGNTYIGDTSVLDGELVLAKSSGYAIPGNLSISATSDRTFVTLNGSDQINPASVVSFGGGNWPYLLLHGNNQTLAGISDSTGNGVIQNTYSQTDVTQTSTLTVNNAADYSFNGYMRDTSIGTGALALVKSGAGTLTLSGNNIGYTGGTTINGGKLVLQNVTNSTYLGSSVVNNGTLELSLSADLNYTAPVSGTGVLSKTGSNTVTLGNNVTCSGGLNIGGGRVVLQDTNTTLLAAPIANGGTLQVNTDANDVTISGPIANGANVGEVVKNGAGTLTLTGSNSYGDGVGWIGFTTVNAGILQADRGVGLPAGSCLNLNGGVLQSNSAATFDTGFWYDWGFVIWNGGGFSAGGGKMTVNLYGDGRTLTWGDNGYVNLAGNMILSSSTAQYETEIQNGIDFNGAVRSIRVNDNPNTAGDYASISGVMSGVGGFTKSGPGSLVIKGSSANTYNGDTNVTEGVLVLAKTGGVAIPGNLVMSAPNGSTFTQVQGSNQIAPTSTLIFAGGYWPHFELLGNAVTVAGISDVNSTGVIENTQWEAGVTSDGVLTVNNAADFSFNGFVRDGNFGGSTGKLALVKSGAGMLTLSGANCGGYTGGLTINAGTLDLTNGVLPGGAITINGGTLIYPGGGHSAAAAAAAALADAVSSGPTRSVSLPSITNNCELVIPTGGNAVLNEIVGTGTTIVSDDAVLTVTSLVQDTLIIGGYDSTISAKHDAGVPTSSLATTEAGVATGFASVRADGEIVAPNSKAVVPEPSMFVLLALAGLALVGACLRRK
jgi:autotransporter-associated beta strand protein